jgi:hypothetical protein
MGFYATGIDSVVLFRNNQEVKNWQTPTGADGVSGSFDDKPSITTVYRLQAKPKDTAKDTIVVYRTVQVIFSRLEPAGITSRISRAAFCRC